MNPLTQIKNTQKATQREIVEGISDKASWHARYKHSAYIFAGGLPYELTEGDLLAVFSQYGEIVDVNLCRDRKTGKAKGFAFLAYMDQRSTVLAVDNLSGARVGGRVVRVEHVDNYKKKKAEMTGEPESEDDDDDGRAGAAPGPSGIEAPRWGNDGFEQQQGSRGREVPNGAAAAGAPGDEPWANANSVFSLLMQAKQQGGGAPPLPGGGRRRPGEEEEAGGRSKEGKEKKEKKHKKEKKKEKKEKKRKMAGFDSGAESSGEEAGGQPGQGDGYGPRRPQAAGPQEGEQDRFGPPRPPARPAREEGGGGGGRRPTEQQQHRGQGGLSPGPREERGRRSSRSRSRSRGAGRDERRRRGSPSPAGMHGRRETWNGQDGEGARRHEGRRRHQSRSPPAPERGGRGGSGAGRRRSGSRSPVGTHRRGRSR